MRHTQRILIMALIASVMALFALPAFAQIGPDLRPPGLEPEHPVDSYSMTGKKLTSALWQGWDLNASDVVFSAAKKRQLISEAPSTIHVITDRDIAAHGWRSLAEILRHVPGVQTLTTKSQFQSVMIRGLVGTEDNNSRILWLQNGVPMNDVRDSGIWLDETYPVEMIKRIEVVLGPGSALYGSGAFQGVVNIFTKDPNDISPYGEYRLVMQNNLTFKASGIAAYEADNHAWGILGHVSANTTQGPGLIADDAYVNYAMDEAVNATSNDFHVTPRFRYADLDSDSAKYWYNINLKFHFQDFKWSLGFSDIYASDDGSEFQSNVAYQQPSQNYIDFNVGSEMDKSVLSRKHAKFYRREFYNDFIYETMLVPELSMLAVLSYRFGQYQNITDYISSKSINENVVSDNEKDTNMQTFQHKLYALAQFDWQIYESNSLVAGLVMEYQYIQADDFINGNQLLTSDKFVISSPINAQKLAHLTPSIFIQDEQKFWDDRIILTAGARFDAYRVYLSDEYKPDYAPSWRFAFLAKWTDWMNMRLSYGYSFKEPSLYQLYISSENYVGNARLEPETLHNIELSFLFTPIYSMKIRAGGFLTFMENLIIMQYDKDIVTPSGNHGAYTPKQESSSATIGGFELSFDWAINNFWTLYSSYNFLYSSRDYEVTLADQLEDTVNNHFVPDDAMHRAKLGATYVTDSLVADLAWFMVGGSPKSVSYMKRPYWQTPFYAIFQPQVTIALPSNFGLSIGGSYAFSKGMTKSPTYRYYYEKEGVPVPRYSVSLSLQYPFRDVSAD